MFLGAAFESLSAGPMHRWAMTVLALACSLGMSIGTPLRADSPVSFSRDVRPLLSENCFFCHGPDAKRREADLRLDTAEGALQALKPGSRADSILYQRLISTDDDERMPPPETHRQLTPQQIEIIGRWLDQGAAWGEHWSFAPLVAPTIPQSRELATPIDAFVAGKLRERQWSHAETASKRVLLRRLALDLTGLPPSPDEVASFESDVRPDAYARRLSRYLADPAFGQRMAWDWLDAARYADSNGYQGDNDRTMWPWRDWVVRAFNDNLPFDQFTQWQLAGDLIPDAPLEAKLATGFCRNHMINGEGGRIAEENRVDYVMDMTETVGAIWLGLTLNCARCHDHKYDPISQQDYYRLFAYFNQTPVDGGGGNAQSPPVLDVPTPAQDAAIDAKAIEVREQRSILKQREKELETDRASWEREQLAKLDQSEIWKTIRPTEVTATHQNLALQEDDSILASGENPTNDTYELVLALPLERLGGIRLEALQHPSMTAGGLARSDSGNFVLTEFEVSLRRAADSSVTPLKITSAEATFEQGDLKVATALDGNPKTGWAVYEGHKVDRSHAAVFRFSPPIEVMGPAELLVSLRHDSPHANHNLGRFRLAVTSQADPPLAAADADLLVALRTDPSQRSDAQKSQIEKNHFQSDEVHRQQSERLQTLENQLADLRKSVPKVMVMADRPEPRKTYILSRGLYNEPTDEVSATVPASLPAPREGPALNRLDLARWLINADQPLTARVTLNRFWQQLFGLGLVKTTEDFGVQGEFPLQVELLDHLASRFRDQGWDTKAILREILLSRTYQQSSRVTAEQLQVDPDNRLLGRGPRYRLPAWMLRDQALAASGLLVRQMNGPGVNVYQPEGVWEEATFGNRKYSQDHGASLYRRSVYVFWRRIIAPTMFFDNASRQTCTVKVLRTNTPLHALSIFNDVTYVEAARHLAERTLALDIPNDQERLKAIYERLLCRSPQGEETDIWLRALQQERERFKSDPAAAEAFLKSGESPSTPGIDVIEKASWASLCLAVMNLDEALSKE